MTIIVYGISICQILSVFVTFPVRQNVQKASRTCAASKEAGAQSPPAFSARRPLRHGAAAAHSPHSPAPLPKKGDTPMCRAGSGSCGAPAPAGAPSTGAAGAAAAPFPQGGPAPCFEGKPSQNTKTKGHPFGCPFVFSARRGGKGPLATHGPCKKAFSYSCGRVSSCPGKIREGFEMSSRLSA